MGGRRQQQPSEIGKTFDAFEKVDTPLTLHFTSKILARMSRLLK